MSGWSESTDCPHCQGVGTLETWGDRHEVGGFCLECGYSYRTVEEQWTLEEVNEERQEACMKLLTELRPSTFKPEDEPKDEPKDESEK